MDEANKTARDYLKEPYSRVLIPDDETGTFAARVAEFPGCFAQGDTPEEAYRNLDAAAESWIEEVLHAGQEVPEPAVGNQYSGRIALRLPKSLHRNAAQLAEHEGTSLNQFLVSAVAEKVGAGNLYEHAARALERRWERMTPNTVVVFGPVGMPDYQASLWARSLHEGPAGIRPLPGRANTADWPNLRINVVQGTQERTEAHG